MPTFTFTSPDGKSYDVEGPEGATAEQAFEILQSQIGSAKPESRSTGEEFGRQLGLTARHAIEGAAGLVGIVADPLGATLDAAIPQKRTVADVVAEREPGRRYIPLRENVSGLLDRAGLPKPETATERVVGGASQALVGGGGFVKGGQVLANQTSRVLTNIGQKLAAAPGTQAASAVSGGGSAEVARESGASPTGQIVAGVVGGFVPGVAATTGPATVRGAFRGGEAGRQRVADNIKAFKDVGTSPTVGQATEGRFARAGEAVLSRVPGGAGPVVNKAETQADEIGAGLDRIASGLSNKRTAAAAGQSVERGISGEGGFVDRFKARSRALYDDLDRHIKGDSPVGLTRTGAVLDQLSKPIQGAAATSKALTNPKLASIQQAIKEDLAAGNGALPYEAVKALRTRIGEELADSALVSDMPRAQLKKLYGALTSDLEAAAAAGGPEAVAALRRANNYYRSGMGRLEVLERVVDKNGGPEAVFKAATAGTKEGATTLRAVMQSLPKENQKDLAAAIVRRLGKAVSSKQGADGSEFSTETFLTNWNNLSIEAKSTLFDRFGPRFKQDMNRVAQVAANLRRGSKVFANPSGTSQGVAQVSAATAFIMSVLTGNLGTAGGIATAAGAANGYSRLMTNPKFVSWLAQTTRVPTSSLNQQITILDGIAKRTGDQDIAEFAETLNSASQEQSRPAGQETPAAQRGLVAQGP